MVTSNTSKRKEDALKDWTIKNTNNPKQKSIAHFKQKRNIEN